MSIVIRPAEKEPSYAVFTRIRRAPKHNRLWLDAPLNGSSTPNSQRRRIKHQRRARPSSTARGNVSAAEPVVSHRQYHFLTWHLSKERARRGMPGCKVQRAATRPGGFSASARRPTAIRMQKYLLPLGKCDSSSCGNCCVIGGAGMPVHHACGCRRLTATTTLYDLYYRLNSGDIARGRCARPARLHLGLPNRSLGASLYAYRA